MKVRRIGFCQTREARKLQSPARIALQPVACQEQNLSKRHHRAHLGSIRLKSRHINVGLQVTCSEVPPSPPVYLLHNAGQPSPGICVLLQVQDVFSGAYRRCYFHHLNILTMKSLKYAFPHLIRASSVKKENAFQDKRKSREIN